MTTQTQPAPVLAWHRIVGIYASDRCRAGLGASADDLASLVAYHDPHATTVRLLEDIEAYFLSLNLTGPLPKRLSAHLGKLKGTQ